MRGRSQRDTYRGDRYDENRSSTSEGRKEANRKKSTGCKTGIGPKSGRRWVSGWNKQTARGMLTFIAGPYSGTSVHTADKSQREYQNWVAKFKINGFPQPGVMPCLYEEATGKVIFNELQMVANPRAANGGYFGTFNKD